ncbi:MAG: hypothetical protein M3Y08_20905 [Fibrobacterota bacterium]|nr:hypothetical protein [Fibrobacterota bacterium]
MEKKFLIGIGIVALTILSPAYSADERVVDGGEKTLAWEDGKLGQPTVVQKIKIATTRFQSGAHSVEITLDSLDGAQDTVTKIWPRQAGVQTLSIPLECVDISKAKAIRVSLSATQRAPYQSGTLQARIFLKTGPNWLWHTTEDLDGNTGMTIIYDDSWTLIESPVENFYSGQTIPGIKHATNLRSIGIQLFTWGGPWSGTIYIDDLEIVDSIHEPVSIRRISLNRSIRINDLNGEAGYGIDGKKAGSGVKAGTMLFPRIR